MRFTKPRLSSAAQTPGCTNVSRVLRHQRLLTPVLLDAEAMAMLKLPTSGDTMDLKILEHNAGPKDLFGTV